MAMHSKPLQGPPSFSENLTSATTALTSESRTGAFSNRFLKLGIFTPLFAILSRANPDAQSIAHLRLQQEIDIALYQGKSACICSVQRVRCRKSGHRDDARRFRIPTI
jgi:hypothetical protein